VEKELKDAGDKVSEADKAPINAAVDKVKEAMKGNDVNLIRQRLTELQQAAHAMAQHMHRGGGGGPQGGPQGPSGDGKGKDDVIDAEFEVKK
jgi:molecular chaperone DnaK